MPAKNPNFCKGLAAASVSQTASEALYSCCSHYPVNRYCPCVWTYQTDCVAGAEANEKWLMLGRGVWCWKIQNTKVLKMCPEAPDLCIQCFMHSVFLSDVCHDMNQKTCHYFRFSNCSWPEMCMQLALLPHYFPTINLRQTVYYSSGELLAHHSWLHLCHLDSP